MRILLKPCGGPTCTQDELKTRWTQEYAQKIFFNSIIVCPIFGAQKHELVLYIGGLKGSPCHSTVLVVKASI